MKLHIIITDTAKIICRNLNSFNLQQLSIFVNDNIEFSRPNEEVLASL